MGLGSVIATNAGTIYGGSGTISVVLQSGNFFADLQVGIGYAPQEGVVTCSVETPDGEYYYLGAISGSSSFTEPYELTYAPAGTYKFHFMSANPFAYEVVAYIFD